MSNTHGRRHRSRGNSLHRGPQAREGSDRVHSESKLAWKRSRHQPNRLDDFEHGIGSVSRKREYDADSVLIRLDPYDVLELQFDLDTAKWLWWEMNKYRTLWNDFTRGDFNSWYTMITSVDSYWLEVLDDGKPVGVVYWTGLGAISDCQVHAMFFDRDLSAKTEICQRIAVWFFQHFPEYHRMTATVPAIYHATVRLIKRMGFTVEGRKRESVLMYGNRVDEMIFGLLASEVL